MNKKSVTLDPYGSADCEIFLRLIQKADCLIEDLPPGKLQKIGLAPAELLKIQPKLVVTSVTAFGQTGPYAHYKAYPLNVFHGGGSGFILPFDDEHKERPPVRGWRNSGEMESGVIASVATLAALYHARVTGEGQHIDISKQEALMNYERMDLGRYPNDGVVVSRDNNPYRMGGKFRCQDGYVIIIPVQNNQWQALAHFLGDPDWTKGEMCKNEFTRAENAVEIRRRITEIFSTMKKDDIYHRGQKYGVPVSPVADVSDVFNSPQLQARGFFVPVEHPEKGEMMLPSLPYAFKYPGEQKFRPAPALGQDNDEVFSGLLGLTEEELKELGKKVVGE